MSEIIEKYVYQLFKPVNGNAKYTKTYCRENEGEYIVYTGTTIGIFAKVNNADYTEPNLTFTTDGENAGTIQLIEDEGYCIGGHRTILKPLVPNLDLLYFKYVLQTAFFENVKRGDVPSLHFSQVKNIRVPVPITSDGSFDIAKQIELANKYKEVEDKKNRLLDKINLLKNIKILLSNDDNVTYKNIPLNDIITHNNGKSIYTKEFCQSKKGINPVYSANNRTPLAYVNFADYNGSYLTYSKNGCAGYISIMNGSFSVNGDRCVITINEGYENVDLLYLKYFLQPIFRSNIKGRMGIDGKNEYTKINGNMIKKLNIIVPIPIKADKTFDLQKQKDLAQKYATIDSIKHDLYNQIVKLTSTIII